MPSGTGQKVKKSKKSVCVTGGSGFIGRHFIKLVENDYDVYNYDLEEGYDIRGAMPYVDFDYIVHFAAKRSVPEGELFPNHYIETNCWGTVNLLIKHKNCRFINISSSSANDVKSIYGATKQFSESVTNLHPNSLNIRLYNVFGEGQSLNSGAVIPTFIRCKQNNETPIVYGDGHQRRDFTYVGDVVESILHEMTSNRTGLVHLGYGTSISVLEIFNEIFGTDIQYIQKPARSFEIVDSKSPTRMPVVKTGRAEGLKRTIEWYDSSLSRIS